MLTLDTPYGNNEDGNVLYATIESNPDNSNLWKTEDGGLDWSDDTMWSDWGDANAPRVMHWGGCGTFTQDEDRVYYWTTGNTLKISSSGGADGTFTNATGTGKSGTVLGSGGFPTDQNQLYLVTTTGIFISTDAGENWVDKTGDFETTVDTLGGDFSVIVPLWIE